MAEPSPAPSMTMPASASLSRDEPADLRGDVGIVHRVGAVGADVLDRQPLAAQQVAQRRLQRDARMVAADARRAECRRRAPALASIGIDHIANTVTRRARKRVAARAA